MTNKQETMPWQPTTSIQTLKARADIIARIRRFFADRDVLEVDTPSLSHATVTDPYVVGIEAIHQNQTLFLQTSPEYAMKRLLAAGAPSIYQICKAYRQGDIGTLHNPEFTILEWYRLHYDHHALMDEMDELLQTILATAPSERISYADLYQQFLSINVHSASTSELEKLVNERVHLAKAALLNNSKTKPTLSCQHAFSWHPVSSEAALDVSFRSRDGVKNSSFSIDSTTPTNVRSAFVANNAPRDDSHKEKLPHNTCLELLFTHCIEPHIAQEKPLFIYDFPISQAALARIRSENPPVASRFEVYFKGVELANGFHELQHADEQLRRFNEDLVYRAKHQLPSVAIDENFIAALQHGLPDCAGVALGVDRLIMLALGKTSLAEVISFPFKPSV